MPQYSHWHYILGYLIVTTSHNWPVMLALALAGYSGWRLYQTPTRPNVQRLYGWLLLAFAYEYIKHLGDYLSEPVEFLLTTDWAWMQTMPYAIVQSAWVLLLVAGVVLLLKALAGDQMRRLFLLISSLLAIILTIWLLLPVLFVARADGQATRAPASTSVEGTSVALVPLILNCVPACQPKPTATPTQLPVPTKTIPGGSSVTRVAVGAQGFADVGPHQLVRSSTDRVYIFAMTIYQNYVRVYRATSNGTPAGFAEADSAHRPTASSTIWSVDSAIDASDVVHIVYITEDGPVIYRTFDTKTDLWGAPTTIANSAWPNRNNGLRQGAAGISLALDASGVAHVLYSKTSGNLRRVYYNTNQGGSWNHEQLLDDQPNADNSHSVLAFGPDGALYAAWLADDGTHGSIRARVLRGGSWGAASLIDDGGFRDDQYSIDQGPALLVAPNGKAHIAYIGTWEPVAGAPNGTAYGHLRHKYSADGGATWISDDPPARYTHDPSLATDAQSNIYLFGHREYWKAQSCADMLAIAQPAGGGWGNWKTLAAGCYDSSVSVKWSQYNWRAPETLDLIYWTEKGPQGQADVNLLQYAELRGGPNAIAGLSSAGGP